MIKYLLILLLVFAASSGLIFAFRQKADNSPQNSLSEYTVMLTAESTEKQKELIMSLSSAKTAEEIESSNSPKPTIIITSDKETAEKIAKMGFVESVSLRQATASFGGYVKITPGNFATPSAKEMEERDRILDQVNRGPGFRK